MRARTAVSVTLPAGRVIVRWKVIGGETEIAVYDPGIRQRIVRIDFDGVAEVLNCLFDTFSGVADSVIAAFKVGVVGLRVCGIASRYTLLFSAR